MPEVYGSHADYMAWVSEEAQKRMVAIEHALRKAFAPYLETHTVEVIVFSNINVFDLARAITEFPSVLKPLVALCNIAARAIERDLQIKNLNTYNPKLTKEQASAIAGYIKSFLPPLVEIPVLTSLDRYAFVDKEIRKRKGLWENMIMEALNQFGEVRFKKRKFEAGGEKFEIDAASPLKGRINIGVDVKRIEARRDIHKRCDEIVNKASKLKTVFPQAKFASVIYYPFIDEHVNIQHRLSNEKIDAISFASDSKESVENAVRMLLASLGDTR